MSLAEEALRALTTCRCDPAWTDRRLHAPDCLAEYREDVDDAIAQAVARGRAGAVADLRNAERYYEWLQHASIGAPGHVRERHAAYLEATAP